MINFAVPPGKPLNSRPIQQWWLSESRAVNDVLNPHDKEQQHAISLEHARAEDIRGLTQVLMTLALLALVWWAALLSVNVSLGLPPPRYH